jgi:hypothetical protein
MIRLGGTSEGGLHVIVAQDKNCKTLTLLNDAEHRTALGRLGMWVAIDECEADVQKRRLQYRGVAEAEAAARVARGDVVVDGLVVTGDPLDAILATVTEIVRAGTPVDLYVDSLNAAATGQHEIDDLVRRLKATGATVFTTAEGTANRAGPMRVKGSTGVAFAADLTVALRYDGKGTLSMRVARSRIANDGTVDVQVDTAGQRFVVAPRADAVSLSAAEANRRAKILETLAKGPKTARSLRDWVKGKAAEIQASLDALLAAGDVVKNGDSYACATAA